VTDSKWFARFGCTFVFVGLPLWGALTFTDGDLGFPPFLRGEYFVPAFFFYGPIIGCVTLWLRTRRKNAEN
jgi:hypothetical protein